MQHVLYRMHDKLSSKPLQSCVHLAIYTGYCGAHAENLLLHAFIHFIKLVFHNSVSTSKKTLQYQSEESAKLQAENQEFEIQLMQCTESHQ